MYIVFFITATPYFVARDLVYKGEQILGCSGFAVCYILKCTLRYTFT